jgi:hypothetical protein
MAGVGIVAAPPNPPEGESSDTEYKGDSAWFLYATVWGHWTWKAQPPPIYYFDELRFSAIRGANGITAWIVGDLKLTYEYTGTHAETTTSGNSLVINVFPNNFPTWARCRSKSKFGGWFGEWTAETDWAYISI